MHVTSHTEVNISASFLLQLKANQKVPVSVSLIIHIWRWQLSVFCTVISSPKYSYLQVCKKWSSRSSKLSENPEDSERQTTEYFAGLPWPQYSNVMAQTETWGDHTILQAASNLYNIELKIVSPLLKMVQVQWFNHKNLTQLQHSVLVSLCWRWWWTLSHIRPNFFQRNRFWY